MGSPASFPFGLRAHDSGRLSAGELARRVRAAGASFVQLAPAKALMGVGSIAGDFGPSLAAGIAATLAAEGIGVAVLGCYVELGSGEPGTAAVARREFEAALRASPAFGFPPVATEAGRRAGGPAGARGGRGDDRAARLRFVRAFAELVGSAEGLGARVAIEAARGHLVEDPRGLRELFAEIASSSLGLILDPANLAPEGEPGAVLPRVEELLASLADRVLAVHLKDLRPGPGGTLLVVPPGKGILPFPALFGAIRAAGLRPPCLVEDCPPEALPAALAALAEAGIAEVAGGPRPAGGAPQSAERLAT